MKKHKKIIQKLKRKKYYAVIFNAGRQVKKIKIKPHDRVIHYGGLSYNINYEAIHLKTNTIMNTKYYFFYHLKNPDPLKITEGDFRKDDFNTDIYNSMLKTKVTKDINDLAFNQFEGLLTPRNIVIALIVISIIVYIIQTGGVQ